MDEYASAWDDYGYDPEDDREPYQCTECGHWSEHGHLSELDDSFLCDECATGAAFAYGGDCV